MEIKIGLQQVQRELTIETEASAAEVTEQLKEALTNEGIVTLTDAKGRTLLIPAAKVAYIDLGKEHQRQVGFGAL